MVPIPAALRVDGEKWGCVLRIQHDDLINIREERKMLRNGLSITEGGERTYIVGLCPLVKTRVVNEKRANEIIEAKATSQAHMQFTRWIVWRVKSKTSVRVVRSHMLWGREKQHTCFAVLAGCRNIDKALASHADMPWVNAKGSVKTLVEGEQLMGENTICIGHSEKGK